MSFSSNLFSGGSRGDIVASSVADIKWVTEVCWYVCVCVCVCLWETDREGERKRERERERGRGRESGKSAQA